MMPVAWTKTYQGPRESPAGCSRRRWGRRRTWSYEGTRRLIVNGCFWAVGLEDQIPEKTKVDLVGEYNPSPFRSVKEWKGTTKPADLARH